MHVIGDFQLNPQRLDLPGGLTESGDLNLNQIEILINGLPSDKYNSVSQCDTKSGTLERYFLTLYRSLGGYYRNTGIIETYNIVYFTPNATGPSAVAVRFLTFIFRPFLTLWLFREFFGSFYHFYPYGPNLHRNCPNFCIKLAKNDAKVAYFLN